MNTPIADFVQAYSDKNSIRLHMPGHKGMLNLGVENLDITEIEGADVLYNSSGIIEQSQNNASKIFGTAKTLYSAEGSSLCIRAMVYLAKVYGEKNSQKAKILAARNAHKTFITAAAVLGVDVAWLYSENGNLLSCTADLTDLENNIEKEKPTALYITSPDYLGNTADIESIGKICKKHNVILMVDNAHGAYLKFLEKSAHPIDLGADICCDSAHKTLPVLTGGAYLHFSKNTDVFFKENAENALSVFASTSPSYLILQSLDKINPFLCNDIRKKLSIIVNDLNTLKNDLANSGFVIINDEPLKITVSAKKYGYLGFELAKKLSEKNITAEFCDPDFLCLMFSCNTSSEEIKKVGAALKEIKIKPEIKNSSPTIKKGISAISPSKAIFSPSERIKTEDALGRILSTPSVSCPPAVPIAICGELVTENTVECFKYYDIKYCNVVCK